MDVNFDSRRVNWSLIGLIIVGAITAFYGYTLSQTLFLALGVVVSVGSALTLKVKQAILPVVMSCSGILMFVIGLSTSPPLGYIQIVGGIALAITPLASFATDIVRN
ncbi:hypothetical protein SAMN04487950_3236 [Halogranum rubrum]|uniref:Uncharacterized protein n=1 Tax=Halogranum rubrum TaxID=553466 RepID=A0A1I4GE79_9EURY|nr:hypothetical protein [Halogranum rubrum]SFL28344.1 hypothetical protein SAMN04487950_3236 [Halogranum rubrum]